jgi:hypothetical protein
MTAQLTQSDSKENFEIDNYLAFPGPFDDSGQNIFKMARSSDAYEVIGHPVFAWDASLTGTTLQRDAQVIVDLLDLPTGQSLIGDIIRAHQSCKGISPLVFTRNMTGKKRNAGRYEWFDYPEACKINLEWYHENMHGVQGGVVDGSLWDSWSLVVNNTTTNQFGFLVLPTSLDTFFME